MTPRQTPPSNLEMEISKNNRAIEVLSVRVETIDQSLNNFAQAVGTVIEQIGLFTQGLTRLENLIERQEAKLDRIFDAIAAQTRIAEAQAKTAEAQATNISTLTRLVELLVSRN